MPFTSLSHLIILPVVQSLSRVCDPMNCSTPGFPVLHALLEFTQTHVHWVGWCHPTISSSVVPFSSCLQSFPASGSFPRSWVFASGGQSTGASASAAVLPGNIQGWFPLGLTDFTSLQSKGLSRVFSSTTVWRDLYHCLQFADEETELLGWRFKQSVSDRAGRQALGADTPSFRLCYSVMDQLTSSREPSLNTPAWWAEDCGLKRTAELKSWELCFI